MSGDDGGLLGTRYAGLARNTIDYWMQPDATALSLRRVLDAFERAPARPESTLRLYLHVPLCAQRCRFCAFSGGNRIDRRQAERYARRLVGQLHEQWRRSTMRGRPVRSVNIGGGSPDLLGPAIEPVLQAVRELPGVGDHTELSVELTLATVRPEFIDRLVAHGVTKVSFGLQSLDPRVRGLMRQPRTLRHLEPVLEWIDGRIPVVNADLITGLPGQTVDGVRADLEALMAEPRIHALSSYLLTTGAAPSLLAAMEEGRIPAPPPALDQALMRLHTYGALRRAGWVRRGTNTYIDPARIDDAVQQRLAGDECIGASRYETHLLAVGPQAVGSVPGVRLENLVDLEAWSAAVERGDPPWCIRKCALVHQRDMALWTFPLRWEGLPFTVLRDMERAGALRDGQRRMLTALQHEGLVVAHRDRLALSLLGEVFMGQLVRDLKGEDSRRAVDDYVREGEALGHAAARGQLRDDNLLNDRQRAARWRDGSTGVHS